MMKILQNPRARAVGIVAVALAAIAAIGLTVAYATPAASSRWRTATAATGDVTQNYLATGTISRKNTAKVSFTAQGTVNKVLVSVGDQVDAGETLATIDTRALKLAVLEAETSVARAELTLYNAQHPKTVTTSASRKKSTTTGSMVTVTFDLKALNAAVTALNTAVAAQTSACDPIWAWVNAEVGGTKTTAADVTPVAKASPQAASDPTATATTAESATPKAAQADPSEAALKACASARVAVGNANTNLTAVMAAINAAAGAPDDNSSPSAGSGGSSSTGTSAKAKAAAIASAKAALLKTEQALISAQEDLSEAELLAPISGTVGVVGLAKGDSAAAGSITIVGSGDAIVSIEVPIATRGSLAIGAAAAVTPAGSLTALTGKVTNINLLQTSGTSGTTSTYTTTITVSDPDELLATGAKASVAIPIKAVTGVVTVPASAVTPTGTGIGTVSVLATGAAAPTTTQVKTGAVGGGKVEITEGLAVGQVVVVADVTADIPANASRNRTRTTTGSTSTGSSGSGTRTASAAPQPSASASR